MRKLEALLAPGGESPETHAQGRSATRINTSELQISAKLVAYHGELAEDEHHRYRSWEHCYSYFQEAGPGGLPAEGDIAALQLAFYLASWGMYRGSSFLLQRSYTVHRNAMDSLTKTEFLPLWRNGIWESEDDVRLVPLVMTLVADLREAYGPFGKATDTLVTKIILGTVGCLPACDRFFIDGFRLAGYRYSSLNRKFVDRIVQFCFKHREALLAEQTRIEADMGTRYPLMKLADMYFWQLGYEHALGPADARPR